MSKKLLDRLKSPDPDERCQAILAVKNDSPKEIATAVCNLIYQEKVSYCIESAIDRLPRLKSISRAKKIPAVLVGLGKREFAVKHAAVKALRKLNAKEHQKELLSILKVAKDELIKVEIIETLGEFDDRGTSKTLKKFLNDKSPLVRGYAASALSQILKKEALPIFKRALKKEGSKWTRSYLLGELVFWGGEDYLDELISLLKSKRYIVRVTTADTLGWVATKKNGEVILPALERALSRESSSYPKEKMEESIAIIRGLIGDTS